MSYDAWMTNFFDVFYSGPAKLKHGPRRVQIEWDTVIHDMAGNTHYLSRLLRLRAHTPETLIEFVPIKLAIRESMEDDLCWYCIGQLEARDHRDDDFENDVEECTCAPPDIEIQD
jgi:hypothetical protein